MALACRVEEPSTASEGDIRIAASLFDQIIGEREQCWRDVEPKHLGGREIYYKLELSRLLDWYLSWLPTLENSINVDGRTAKEVVKVGSVGHECALFRKASQFVDGW